MEKTHVLISRPLGLGLRGCGPGKVAANIVHGGPSTRLIGSVLRASEQITSLPFDAILFNQRDEGACTATRLASCQPFEKSIPL